MTVVSFFTYAPQLEMNIGERLTNDYGLDVTVEAS